MRQLLRRVRYVLRQRRHDADLREELDFHREMKEQELRRAGATARQAAAAARRALGNDVSARGRARDVWIAPWLQDVCLDARLGVRLLVKDRRLTVAAVAGLALALAATTTAFTFVRGALLRDLPLADGGRLVFIRSHDSQRRPLGISYADARDWRAATKTLSHLALSLELPINVAEDALPAQRFYGSFVSIDLFEMVQQRPVLGRSFRAEDNLPGAPRVALLAHRTWHSRYGGQPSVIGRTVRVNDVPSTIVGVMPEGFHFPANSEIWVPIGQVANASRNIDATRGSRPVLVLGIGRLADGIDVSQAQAEMDAITSRLARDHPSTNQGIAATLEPLEALLRGAMKAPVLIVMGAVSCVWLIACVNVANLLLARAIHRGREITVRAALGASRWRIVRQLVVESVLLAALAGAIGLALSFAGVEVFAAQLTQMFGDGPPPYWLRFSVDGPVFMFAAALTLGSTVLFGLAPALHLTRFHHDALKAWTRGATSGPPARRWVLPVMAGQLALVFVLLAGTGLLARSFLAVTGAARVLDTTGLVTMQLAISALKYTQPEQIKQFYRALDDRLAAAPGLSAVTVASDIPLRTVINATRELTMDGQSDVPGETRPTVEYLFVGPRYFETLKVPLIRGRDFADEDGAPGRETAIVNQRFALMFFPGRDVIGQRITLRNPAAAALSPPPLTIVGVVPNVPQILLRDETEPLVYVPVRGEPAPHRFVSIIARSTSDLAATVARLREEVRAVDPDLPGYGARTMDDVLSASQWQYRVFGSMFGLVAAIALVLATVGVFATIAHSVQRRAPEVGVRVALGATPAAVTWLFVKRTALELAIGLTLGLPAAALLGRLLAGSRADPYASTFLIGTSPVDPVALGSVSALLITVTAVACLWPARRAARLDPVAALRQE